MAGLEGRKERKVVTVLFADLVGFTSRAETLDPEDVEAILQPYHARLRSELERFGGTVEKFIGDPVVAKGKAELVAVWEAVRPRAPIGLDVTRSHAAPLVSRERELDALKDALTQASADRSPRLVTLVGVPGIGKSRLVHELRHSMEADPVHWLRGRSLPYADGVSFLALAEIVKAHSGILETDPPDLAQRKLRRSVAAVVGGERDIQWVERHLQPLVGLGSESFTAGDRRAEAFAAWRRFIATLAAERPPALVFDDLHLADDDLLDFLESLPE